VVEEEEEEQEQEEGRVRLDLEEFREQGESSEAKCCEDVVNSSISIRQDGMHDCTHAASFSFEGIGEVVD